MSEVPLVVLVGGAVSYERGTPVTQVSDKKENGRQKSLEGIARSQAVYQNTHPSQVLPPATRNPLPNAAVLKPETRNSDLEPRNPSLET